MTVLALLLVPFQLFAQPIRVVTSTQSLASITEYIGGRDVDVTSLAVGHVDLHFFEPKPSMVIAVTKADMVVKVGMAFDGYVDALVESAKNPKVFPGHAGYVDASKGVPKLEVPKGPITMAMGDIHEEGNPHYYLDPRNGRYIAKNILDGLVAIDPDNANAYQKRYEQFLDELDKRILDWNKNISVTKGKTIVTYHRSWSYLLDYLELSLVATIEPLPGLPPTPKHIKYLTEDVIKESLDYVLIASIYSPKVGRMIQEQTGALFLQLPVTLEKRSKQFGYFEFLDHLITAFDPLKD